MRRRPSGCLGKATEMHSIPRFISQDKQHQSIVLCLQHFQGFFPQRFLLEICVLTAFCVNLSTSPSGDSTAAQFVLPVRSTLTSPSEFFLTTKRNSETLNIS